MNSNAWDFLGIPPNSDRHTVRKAYARILKKMNPEDDPKSFLLLRKAYQDALNQLRQEYPTRPALQDASESPVSLDNSANRYEGERQHSDLDPTHPNQTPDQVEPPDQTTLAEATSRYESYIEQSIAGDGDLALESLEPWMAVATYDQRAVFDQHLFEDVLSGRMPRGDLLPLIWKFYWRNNQFHFHFQPPRQHLSRFQKIIQLTIEEDLWQIRSGFAKSVADGNAAEGLANLEFLLSTKAFDNLERRHMLRLIMLRFVSRNPFLSQPALEFLEELFQFSAFLAQYSAEDRIACLHLSNRLHSGT